MSLGRFSIAERPKVLRKWKRESPRRPDVGMLAVDTNLIVRYLTGDHPKQSAKARAVIDGEDVFVSTTVVLETEWVLRSVYSYDPAQICAALRAFAGLSRVSLED